jgi:hypothetical protein
MDNIHCLPLALVEASVSETNIGLPPVTSKSLTTRDGVQINYHMIGNGPKIFVFCHGKETTKKGLFAETNLSRTLTLLSCPIFFFLCRFGRQNFPTFGTADLSVWARRLDICYLGLQR